MYIKYVNLNNATKIEKLDLSFEEVGEYIMLSNCNQARKIVEVLSFSVGNVAKSLDLENYAKSESFVVVCGQEKGLTPAQFERFLRLLENALQRDVKMFDIAKLTTNDIGEIENG